MADTDIDQKEFEILANFRFRLRQYLNFSDQAATSIGLTPQRYTALLFIVSYSKNEEMTVGSLAKRLLIKHHSAVGLVDRLEIEGLARRVPSKKDHRQVCVEITPKGKKLLDQLASIHKDELQRIGPEIRQLLKELGIQAE